MSYVEIEVRARTVDLAVEAAMHELGVEDRSELQVEVISEPEKGFLGIGGKDAVVRVKRRKPRQTQKKRRRGGQNQRSSAPSHPKDGKNGKNGGGQSRSRNDSGKGRQVSRGERPKRKDDDRPMVDIEEQADIARDFLEGLIDAYGLEGSVRTSVDDDVIVADILGEQTEALIGIRGTVRSSIHEITRTVLQRHTNDTARLRLDIAGYAERRRQALTIYADQLIDQLMEEGGEIMLEPMSASDRKVIHDAAAARTGVSSYSEGESPRRFVVLAVEPGLESSSEEE